MKKLVSASLLAAGLALAGAVQAAPVTLLNVSYDVMRDFYKDYNAAFQKHWEAEHPNDKLTLQMSFGGSSKQARSVIDGLEAEGEAPNLVLWAVADDIQGLWRCRQALEGGKPLPMVLREQRIWGPKERHFERLLPRLKPAALARLVASASTVDGIVKGLPHPQWPSDPWDALRRLATHLCEQAATP